MFQLQSSMKKRTSLNSPSRVCFVSFTRTATEFNFIYHILYLCTHYTRKLVYDTERTRTTYSILGSGQAWHGMAGAEYKSQFILLATLWTLNTRNEQRKGPTRKHFYRPLPETVAIELNAAETPCHPEATDRLSGWLAADCTWGYISIKWARERGESSGKSRCSVDMNEISEENR